MAVNRGITGTAHQGGNFTAGILPTLTLKKTVRKRGFLMRLECTDCCKVLSFFAFCISCHARERASSFLKLGGRQ